MLVPHTYPQTHALVTLGWRWRSVIPASLDALCATAFAACSAAIWTMNVKLETRMTGVGKSLVTVGRSAGSSGGQANEGGSLYRSGVAAYLAAHGLKGRGVEAAGYSEAGPAPVALLFETSEAVDDIRCELADGSAIVLQAKRACGADEQLQKTVSQWVRYLPDLKTGDRMGLATAHPRGSVRALGAALSRRQRSVPGPSSTSEQEALAAVRDRLPPGTSLPDGERVLDTALVMTVATETERDGDFRYAASLLDGTVVPAGSGSAAVRALQRAFQEQAASGAGSGLDEWLQVLATAGLEVFPDADGSAGMRRRAELDAVAAHRRRLAERDGLLEYALLADDLPPLRYEQLAESFRVSVMGGSRPGDEADFLAVARRWSRMLLTGLPGTGKSTALRQLAARWAANPQAPVPVLVPLLEVARRRPRTESDLTLAVLIEAATETAPESQRAPLRRALSEAAVRGEAVLLLDGLDECRNLRAVVADGLAKIADDLPEGTGILLATRDSGRAASGKLGFPEARMAEPNHLKRSLSQLLQHVARYRVPEASRVAWVHVRQEWLDEARRGHRDPWQIPLLATLITLLATQREPAALPSSRAHVLTEVVRDSVERWEHARGNSAAGGLLVIRAEMLTDGFREIAHGLATGGSLPEAAVRGLVAAMLSSRWGLSPGEAGAAAGDVTRFWDDHVGVFVSSTASGQVEARSRVFTEIGDAMWVTQQDRETEGAWVRAALADEDRREPVILAACLSQDVSGILAAEVLSPEADPAGALTLADAAAEGAALTSLTAAGLLARLVNTASQPPDTTAFDNCRDLPGEQPARGPRAGRDGQPSDRAWPYVRRAAMLRLPPSLRSERRFSLAGLGLTGDWLLVATALSALTDAQADCRTALEPDEASAVRRLLEYPAASSDRALLPGHISAAEQAISYLPQLGPDAPAAIFRIAGHGTLGLYRRVRARLTALGFTDQQAKSAGRSVARLFSGILPDHSGDWNNLFEAAGTADTVRALSHAEKWRLPDLANLFDVLDPLRATVRGINDAYTVDRERLPGVLRATARAAGIELPALAGQAVTALASWSAGDRGTAGLLLAPPPSPPSACDITSLPEDDMRILIDALGATSAWVAGVAAHVLMQARNPAVGQAVARCMPGNSPDASRRRNAAIVVLANDPDPARAAMRMLDGADQPARVGAAAACRVLAGRWGVVASRALADTDLSVRLACRDDADSAGVTVWSCPRCAQANDVAAPRCVTCRGAKVTRVQGLPRAAPRWLGVPAEQAAERQGD